MYMNGHTFKHVVSCAEYIESTHWTVDVVHERSLPSCDLGIPVNLATKFPDTFSGSIKLLSILFFVDGMFPMPWMNLFHQ